MKKPVLIRICGWCSISWVLLLPVLYILRDIRGGPQLLALPVGIGFLTSGLTGTVWLLGTLIYQFMRSNRAAAGADLRDALHQARVAFPAVREARIPVAGVPSMLGLGARGGGAAAPVGRQSDAVEWAMSPCQMCRRNLGALHCCCHEISLCWSCMRSHDHPAECSYIPGFRVPGVLSDAEVKHG